MMSVKYVVMDMCLMQRMEHVKKMNVMVFVRMDVRKVFVSVRNRVRMVVRMMAVVKMKSKINVKAKVV